jgi:hypothetical protein
MDRQERLDRFLLDLHMLAMTRLRGNAEALAAMQVRLKRIRRRAQAQRFEATWNRWQALLDGGDFAAIEQAACAVNVDDAALRANSPIHALFEQHELAALLDQTAPEARRAFIESLSAPSVFGALAAPSASGVLGKAER